MYKLVKNETQFNKSDLMFDFYNSRLENWLPYFIYIDKTEQRYAMNLNYFSLKQINKLCNIIDGKTIEKLLNDSKYKCPFNDTTHYSLIPLAILTKTPSDYIDLVNPNAWYKEMLCDIEYSDIKDKHLIDNYVNDIDIASLGSGYTDVFYPHDGRFGKSVIGINLKHKNEDTIVFGILKWYNK